MVVVLIDSVEASLPVGSWRVTTVLPCIVAIQSILICGNHFYRLDES